MHRSLAARLSGGFARRAASTSAKAVPAAAARSVLGSGAARLRAGSIVIGVGGSVAYLSYARLQTMAAAPASSPAPAASAAAAPSAPAAPTPPPFDISAFSNFKSLEDFKQNQEIILYQYETCPFCNKVRAYLDHEGIRYRTIEVNPLTKAEKKAAGGLVAACKEVPVLVVNGQVLTDSTPIIKNLNAIQNLYRAPAARHEVSEAEQDALRFVDARIVILTAPNIYRTWRESVDSFDYIARNSQLSANASALNQALTKYSGAAIMYALSELKLKKKYNITDPRAALYTALAEFVQAFPQGQPFRGGAQPNLADITAYGVMRAIQGYETGRDVMNPHNTSERFVEWYKQMDRRVQEQKAKA